MRGLGYLILWIGVINVDIEKHEAPGTMAQDLNKDQIAIVVDKENLNEEQVVLEFEALDLGEDDTELSFEIASMSNPKIGWMRVYLSEELEKEQVLSWRPFIIPTKLLCDGGKLEQPFKIVFFQCKGLYKGIGEATTTLAELMTGKRDFRVESKSYTESNDVTKNDSKSIGKLYVRQFRVLKPNSYTDYIAAGLKFHITVAIDFSASNNDPKNPKSLHSTPSTVSKDYKEAVASMFSTLKSYTWNKQFSVLGFGAETEPSTSDGVFCISQHGVSGASKAYHDCVGQIKQPSSADFAPVIRHIMESARDYKTSGEDYFLLMILTDGEIMDMEEAREAIVKASVLPVSIVFVGVGAGRYYDMEDADGNLNPLEVKGKGERDIVHFVFYNRIRKLDGTRMAEKLLAEIPQQVMYFMRSHMFEPKSQN